LRRADRAVTTQDAPATQPAPVVRVVLSITLVRSHLPAGPRRLLAAAALLAVLAAVAALPALAARKQPARRPTTITVTATLQALQRSNQITPTEYNRYANAYVAAKRSLGRLSGTRQSELAGVINNVQAIAAAHGFIPSRLPALFLTLEANRKWWTTGPLIASRARITVPGSHLVWEYYAGQGIEIQWLGTFGKANGYFLSGHENTQLRELLAEAIPLATHRAGGLAWEYMFQFDGGLPPWTSGLSQGTALQVFSRAWQRFHEQIYLTTAQQALGIFQTAPPQGVRVATPAGAEYAEYTYAPSDRILNGFIQSLVGLYDYTMITHDPLGQKLFEAGDTEARAETPHYNTGGWSMYDQHEESDLSYHELLAEFLLHLCQRTRGGPPIPVAPPPVSTTTSTTTTGTATTTSTTTSTSSTTTPGGANTGGSPSATAASAPGAAARTAAAKAPATPPPTPIAGDAIYCTTAEEFSEDVHTPPALELLTQTVRRGTRAGVQFSLSKVSSVHMSVSLGGHTVWSNGATIEGGKPRLLWLVPTKTGAYTVTLSATDLAGNHSSTTGTVVVRR
jgi:hypothetical protein